MLSLAADVVPRIAGVNASKKLHQYMIQRIIHCPLAFFNRTPFGRIISRFSRDVDMIDNQLPDEIYGFVYCFWMVNYSP